MPAQGNWCIRLAMAREWCDVVNKHSEDVALPDVRVKSKPIASDTSSWRSRSVYAAASP